MVREQQGPRKRKGSATPAELSRRAEARDSRNARADAEPRPTRAAGAVDHETGDPVEAGGDANRAAPRAAGARLRPSLKARKTKADPGSPVAKGSFVRVIGGTLDGKTGIVQQIEGRGYARVMIGLLATRVKVADLLLVSSARARPMLSSSHRKRPPQS